jgi:hypothetical protein
VKAKLRARRKGAKGAEIGCISLRPLRLCGETFEFACISSTPKLNIVWNSYTSPSFISLRFILKRKHKEKYLFLGSICKT